MCVTGLILQMGKLSLRGGNVFTHTKEQVKRQVEVLSGKSLSAGFLRAPFGSLFSPQMVVAGKSCVPPHHAAPPHGKQIQKQLCPRPGAARTSLQKVFTRGNSQHREAMASKLLATAANLQKAWCSVCRSSRDSPHSLSACSPEAFFSFCNPMRARYPTGLHINGKWGEGQEWRPLEDSVPFSPVPEILRHLSEMLSTPHPCSTLKSTRMLREKERAEKLGEMPTGALID